MSDLTPVIISGPTASGKSKLAEALVRILSGEIINADSLQIYKGLPILTAQPEMLLSHHHLYSFLDPFDKCNVARWVVLVKELIQGLWKQGKRPIIVGGTGMYIKALVEGVAEVPKIPAEIVARAKEWIEKEGGSSLYKDLIMKDPQSVVLKPGDSQRVIRAWSVYEATGKPLKDWQSQKSEALGFPLIHIVCDVSREVLYQRINDRFEFMWSNGILDEVRLFLSQYQSIKNNYAAKAIGFIEACEFLEKKISEEEAVERAKRRSRQYAKRQLTWLRHQVKADLVASGPDYDVRKVEEFCRGFRVTSRGS